jgi:hypothetical protein
MKDIRNSLKFHLVVCLLLLFIVNMSYATEISLRWQANAEPDLEGYEIYYAPLADGLTPPSVVKVVLKLKGVASTKNYDEELSDNTNPSYIITGLDSSVNYIIALKAYDNENLVSEFSEEYTIFPIESNTNGNSGGGGGGGCFLMVIFEF